MANSYFTFTTSDSSVSKRFRVILTGYEENHNKTQSVNRTLDGTPDISVGSIQRSWNFLVRVRVEEAPGDAYTPGFGTKDDLLYFYSLNNPNGTPTDVITFVDHYGDTHLVKILGSYSANAMSVIIDGPEALFTVQVSLLKVG